MSKSIKTKLLKFSKFIFISLLGIIIFSPVSRIDASIDPKIEPYINQLLNEEPGDDKEAIRKLKEMDEPGIDALINTLSSDNVRVRHAVIIVLGESGSRAKKSVVPLLEVLKNEAKENSEVRTSAAISLGTIGENLPDVVSTLIEYSKPDQYQALRLNCIIALGRIAPTNPASIQAFIDALQDRDRTVRLYATSNLAKALRRSESLAILNKVKEALKHKDWKVKLGAASALARSGRDVKLGVSTIEELLQDNDEEIIQNAIETLSDISRNLSEQATLLSPEERLNAKEGLQKIIETLKNPKDNLKNSGKNLDEVRNSLENSLTVISALQDKPSLNTFYQWIQKNPKVSIPMGIIILWLSSVLTLLWLRPLLLLRINDTLQRYTDIPLPDFLGGIQLSTLRRLLFGSHYHPRVLDAWVESHLDTAHKEFQKKQTVKERTIYISMPVVLDGKNIAELTAQDLQQRFTEQRERLLIWGEGGSGKTSLACQLAKWAMSDEPEQRLCKHRMLPILIERELDLNGADAKQAFTELINGKLQDLIDARQKIPDELLEHLLRQQRLLVIVDGFSEMSKDSREQIQPQSSNFPVNALVVTSRVEEKLGNVNKTTLKPMRVEGNRLSSFMEAYLRKLGKRDLFNDEKFFQACSRLSALVGQGNITILLAKLYAEQMVAVEEGTTRDNLPNNIPDLMLYYLNLLNDRVDDTNKLPNSTIHHDLKIIAWECLRQSYKPATAQRDVVLNKLGGEDAKTRLAYLENSLQVIQTNDLSEERLRFSLDPLAEYLAGLYLVKKYGDNEQLWSDFFIRIDAQSSALETTKGFLRVLLDCYLAKVKEYNLPDFLLQELKQRTNFDAAASDTINN
jgi:HEAT repeat protein